MICLNVLFVCFMYGFYISKGKTHKGYCPMCLAFDWLLTFTCILASPMDLNTVKFYYANPCFPPCDFYGCFFFFLLSMSVLKAHKSLCYYLIFTHVPTMNKTLNLNLNLNLVFVNSICLFRTHTLINSDISVKCRSLRNGQA